MAITSAPPSVRGIFALDITTSILALLLFGVQCLFATRASSRRRSYAHVNSTSPKRHTPLGTFAFLLPGTALLCLAYAATAANVALLYDANQAVSVTPAYSYHYPSSPDLSGTATEPTATSLSFLVAFAIILSTTLLTGAVWLHASHVTSNGTGVGAPSRRSIVWNTAILGAMLATGLASWGRALAIRSPAVVYGTILSADSVSRDLYVAFRVCVIVSSSSVSLEAVRRYQQVSATGLPGTSSRPILARLAFYAVPIFALRNATLVVELATLYVAPAAWSSLAAREAVAFVLVVFGQVADWTIFAIVTWGAAQMGRGETWG